MQIFIDANVLLDFYRLSGGDLEEIRKITKLAESEQITLYLSDYLLDEFERNRERTIALAAEQFRKCEMNLHLPNLVRGYPEAQALAELRAAFHSEKMRLITKLENDIGKRSLQADQVIDELFSSIKHSVVPKETFDAGIRRSQLGRPPGKPGSTGDAIHWEWLLTVVPEKESIVVVSADGDFESPAIYGIPNAYLLTEWSNKKNGELIIYKTLTEFFEVEFPDIKLADEIAKNAAIDKLCTSTNFATTHKMIGELLKYDDFAAEEVEQMLHRYVTNSQIHWILGDEDVYEFGSKLVKYAHDLGLDEEATPLEAMLADLSFEEK